MTKKNILCYSILLFDIIFLLNFRIIHVNGQSMCPTLHDGQFCLAMITNKIEDGDIIILNTKQDNIPADYIIKRFYEDKSDSTSVFVQGDNTEHSLDSRVFGNFDREKIVGKIIFPLLPSK